MRRKEFLAGLLGDELYGDEHILLVRGRALWVADRYELSFKKVRGVDHVDLMREIRRLSL